MIGHKERASAPLTSVSLGDLVPADHFYRHLDQMLDLACVRDLVQDCYAVGGRPSVDPVVFFRLQLAMFFEGGNYALGCSAGTGTDDLCWASYVLVSDRSGS